MDNLVEFEVEVGAGIPTLELGNGDLIIRSFHSIGNKECRGLAFNNFKHGLNFGVVPEDKSLVDQLADPMFVLAFIKRECLENTIFQLQDLLDGWSDESVNCPPSTSGDEK